MASKRKRVLNATISLREAAQLTEVLRFTDDEWQAVIDAAEDARLTPASYCRIMVLAAAGMGGIVEHLDRAIGGSLDVGAALSALQSDTDAMNARAAHSSKQKRRGR